MNELPDAGFYRELAEILRAARFKCTDPKYHDDPELLILDIVKKVGLLLKHYDYNYPRDLWLKYIKA